ncbi:MAG: hypothetical protein DBO99_15860 [gamma proteobacterium symbiont of Ctena orbiculata]|nr:MAG: hypothetical protein DBO99_15860 [gamma proteobacterium symbiont of Ctena orbiculata]
MAKQAKRSIIGDIRVLFFGVLSLLTGMGKAQLSDMDHLHELDSNQQLRASSIERKAKHKKESLLSVGNRIKTLRSHIAVSLLWLSTATLIAIITEDIAGAVADSSFLGIWSALAFGVATLGRLGWSGQSFSGDTIVERLDRGLFWFLYWAGMFVATWAVLP